MLKSSLFAALAANLIIFSVPYSYAASTGSSIDEKALLDSYMSANGYGDTETNIIVHLADASAKMMFTRLYQFVKIQPQVNQITFPLVPIKLFGMGALFVPDPLLSENMALLHLTSTDEIKTGFPILNAMFNADTEDYKTKSVMRLYGDSNNAYSENFQSQISEIFNIETVHVDYSKSTESAAAINEWVKSETSFTTTDILPEYRISSDTGAIELGSSSLVAYWSDDVVVTDAETQGYIEITGPINVAKYEALNATVLSIPLAGGCERKIIMADNADSKFDNTLYTFQDADKYYEVIMQGETINAKVCMPNDTYITGREHYVVALKLSDHLHDLFVPKTSNVCDGVFEGKTDCGHLSVLMHELELSIQNKPSDSSERRRRDTTDAETEYTTIQVTEPYASVVMCHGVPYYATLNFGSA